MSANSQPQRIGQGRFRLRPHPGRQALRGRVRPAGFFVAALLALLACLCIPRTAPAQSDTVERLHRDQFRSGEDVLRAFAPVSKANRNSIVKLNVDGETVALGAVIDSKGLALTKASEIRKGQLTAWLANDREVAAEVLEIEPTADVALVRVQAEGLKPVVWAEETLEIGQWAITPGITETPHAVGIVSALPRRIRPPRAFIGIQFDLGSQLPRIDSLMPGLGAERAGLKPGDLILAVNRASVTNREQVVEIVREFGEGQRIAVQVQRGGKEQIETEIELKSWAGDDSADAGRPSSRLSGRVSTRAEGFEQAIEHDTILQPWLCGGPLVNLDGKAIGLNIARAGRVSTYALPSSLARRIAADLKARAGRKIL